jgi:putative dimethyl sulfoxide reductase chaperone
MTTFVWKKYIEVAEARSQVYGLLSALYMELPDLKWLDGIFDAGFQQNFSSIASGFQTAGIKEGLELITGFVGAFKTKPREEVLKLVSIDRTRLLHGVGKNHSPPPPYESIYRDGRIWGKSTEEVAQTCSRLGIKLSSECSEPPDYIGIEFDLMRLICSAEKEAWEAGSIDKAGKYLQVGSEFLEQHIMKWVPDFCEQMYHKSELDFYRGIARLTRGFVEYDNLMAEQQLNNIKQKLGWEP